MKKFFISIICILLIFVAYIKKDVIVDYLYSFIKHEPSLVIKDSNQYVKTDHFMYLQNTENFVPYSYHDLFNIFYTTVNNGWDTFTFYCPEEYTSCMDDMAKLDSTNSLNYLNDFVHPFNSVISLSTTSSSSGEVTIVPNYLYSYEQINQINKRVDEIISEYVNPNETDRNKIKAIHDYIINNASYDTEYDQNKVKDGTNKYDSAIAYGPLFQGKAICNGYADLMAIFLTKMGYTNYKIATRPEDNAALEVGHIWNAVKLGDKWYHLDLTWDDPISQDGQEYLFHKYFLINNTELSNVDSGNVKLEEHNFDKSIYLEFNELTYS